MGEVHLKTKHNLKYETDDSENIPYHARENARPFTYGTLPKGFTRNHLNHVVDTFDETSPIQNANTDQDILDDLITHTVQLKNDQTEKDVEYQSDETNNSTVQLNFLQRDTRVLPLQNRLSTDKLGNAIENEKPLQEGATCEIISRAVQNLNHDLCLPKEHAVEKNGRHRCETPNFPHQESVSLDNRCTSPYRVVLSENINKNTKGEKYIKQVQNKETENFTVDPNFVNFARDTLSFWYKPYISREEALRLLCGAEPGSFIIRHSTTYKNCYGLVLRVSRPPVKAAASNNEQVRHYLLEVTDSGVRLRGYLNEPTFTSLSAFVYQHTIVELALPCKLIIPKKDLPLPSGQGDLTLTQEQLLSQGAACNVLYLFSHNTESLTGDEAIRSAVNEMFSRYHQLITMEVHFKVSKYGITITDNKRLLFFRRHYLIQNISHFGIEPDNRNWTVPNKEEGFKELRKTLFAFVSRAKAGSNDNQCHIFCELSENQPASAIVCFTYKVLALENSLKK